MTTKEFEHLKERDGYCLHCGRDDETLVPQHRGGRGMGGHKAGEKPSNVVLFCSWFNGLIESNWTAAELAKAHGWKLARWQDPRKYPVTDVVTGLSYWLDDEYNRAEAVP